MDVAPFPLKFAPLLLIISGMFPVDVAPAAAESSPPPGRCHTLGSPPAIVAGYENKPTLVLKIICSDQRQRCGSHDCPLPIKDVMRDKFTTLVPDLVRTDAEMGGL